jgi:hypothetical protein
MREKAKGKIGLPGMEIETPFGKAFYDGKDISPEAWNDVIHKVGLFLI